MHLLFQAIKLFRKSIDLLKKIALVSSECIERQEEGEGKEYCKKLPHKTPPKNFQLHYNSRKKEVKDFFNILISKLLINGF
jgi:hypothetical protein